MNMDKNLRIGRNRDFGFEPGERFRLAFTGEGWKMGE
jgi:hypothetical protein